MIAEQKILQNAVHYLIDMFQVLKNVFLIIKLSTIVLNIVLTNHVKNVTVLTILWIQLILPAKILADLKLIISDALIN